MKNRGFKGGVWHEGVEGENTGHVSQGWTFQGLL